MTTVYRCIVGNDTPKKVPQIVSTWCLAWLYACTYSSSYDMLVFDTVCTHFPAPSHGYSQGGVRMVQTNPPSGLPHAPNLYFYCILYPRALE